MNCKKCGQEIDKKAIVCTGCGCKIKKPLYKKWWLWAIVLVFVVAIASSGENENNNTTQENDINQAEQAIVYEQVDLSSMIDELKENAMKAEKNYQNKNIEITAKIKSFDSDGKYISVEPQYADVWNFESAMCYIKNDTQRDFLVEKNVGDIITIKGKVKSIGEVLGYSIDIAEVY